MSIKYALPGLALLASACTVTPIKTVEPVASSGIWKNGVMFIESRQPDSVVLVGYSQYSKDGYAFEAVITNNGPQPVLFEPANIQCRQFSDSDEMVREEPVLDPELKIAQLTRDLQSEEEEPLGFALLNLADSTVDLFDGPDTPEQAQARLEEEQFEADQEARIARLKAEQEKYMKELLRKHQLEPGEVIVGKLVCPGLSAKASKLQLQIPVGDSRHEIDWRTAVKSS
ncbi:MAG: hypothetical protein VYA55_04995 [Pseudomonadota bacterium]|nr:hypothetical protein [Pseudomonadota bacterium]